MLNPSKYAYGGVMIADPTRAAILQLDIDHKIQLEEIKAEAFTNKPIRKTCIVKSSGYGVTVGYNRQAFDIYLDTRVATVNDILQIGEYHLRVLDWGICQSSVQWRYKVELAYCSEFTFMPVDKLQIGTEVLLLGNEKKVAETKVTEEIEAMNQFVTEPVEEESEYRIKITDGLAKEVHEQVKEKTIELMHNDWKQIPF